MLAGKQLLVGNSILGRLPIQDLIEMRPFLQRVVLEQRMVLQEPRRPSEHVHFVESGLISMRTVAAGNILETATVGRWGAVGVSALLGTHVPIHQSVVLFSGSALRIHVDDLRRLVGERPQLREHSLKYVQSLIFQTAQMALCCVHHGRQERLAAWLCLACDAVDGNVLPVTHDQLSVILGLRRAGVTEALIEFNQQGLVRKTRGVLEIANRQELGRLACGCYETLTREYYSKPQFGRVTTPSHDAHVVVPHATRNGPPSN